MGKDISHSERELQPSLQRWQKTLDDVKLLYDLPSLHLEKLLHLSDDLYKCGQIDALERFDMDEMARAAFESEIEARLVLNRYYRPGGYYRLTHAARAVGEIRGCRVYFGEDTRDRTTAMFDVWIERTRNGLEALTRHRQPAGRIDGKLYLAATGETFELIETARIIGQDYHAIDDPDGYRAILDAIQYAAEQGDTAKHAALAKRASVSIFMPCPGCDDSFSRREDCGECEGLGFVRETPARFRWRS